MPKKTPFTPAVEARRWSGKVMASENLPIFTDFHWNQWDRPRPLVVRKVHIRMKHHESMDPFMLRSWWFWLPKSNEDERKNEKECNVWKIEAEADVPCHARIDLAKSCWPSSALFLLNSAHTLLHHTLPHLEMNVTAGEISNLWRP